MEKTKEGKNVKSLIYDKNTNKFVLYHNNKTKVIDALTPNDAINKAKITRLKNGGTIKAEDGTIIEIADEKPSKPKGTGWGYTSAGLNAAAAVAAFTPFWLLSPILGAAGSGAQFVYDLEKDGFQ